MGVPTISIIIGEGGSGGAIALASSNKILMFENAIYSVISPEGCATILWRDPKKMLDAAKAMKLSAKDLLELQIIDEIIEAEPNDGLWNDNRSDEEQIGASYEEIEDAMMNFNKSDNLSKREKEVLDIFNSFHKANKHKMDPIPVCEIPKDYL